MTFDDYLANLSLNSQRQQLAKDEQAREAAEARNRALDAASEYVRGLRFVEAGDAAHS